MSKTKDITTLIGDRFGRIKEALSLALNIAFLDRYPVQQMVRGDVFLQIEDIETGKLLHEWEKRNIVVQDGSILVARLCKDNQEPNFGINMLAVGTGAAGALLSPDAPDVKQRKLNAEIARKGFSSTVFRDAGGLAVSYPTRIVDFTTVFGASEANGPLNEMALLSTISPDPLVKNLNPESFPNYDATLDITPYDMAVNYLTFSVISKPVGSKMTITWRLTF